MKFVIYKINYFKCIPFLQAVFSRDALSKHIYAKLFDWIVTQINKCFAAKAKPYRYICIGLFLHFCVISKEMFLVLYYYWHFFS